MLKTLLKYDLKAVFKYWWIAALSSVVLSFVGGWSISVFSSEKELPTVLYVVATILSIVAVLGIVVFSFATIIFVYSRFYKNFFTDEGYLTFTLPVKRSQLLNSKLITSILANTATGLVIYLDIIIAFCIGVPDSLPDKENLRMIWEEYILEAIDILGFHLAIWIVEAILLLLLFSMFTTLFVFTCITIASIIAKKAKIITAIGIYYVANSVFSTVLSMFWLFGIDFIVDLSDSIPLNYSGPVFSLLMLTGILFLGMLCVACYSFQYWMLDRKLNLS